MFKKIFRFFFKRKSKIEAEVENKHYPYSEKIRHEFPHCYTPIIAMDFVRALMYLMNIGMTEVEILLLIVAEENGRSLNDILDHIFHAKDDHVKVCLRSLKRHGYIEEEKLAKGVYQYRITDTARHQIKNLHK